jgi:hypothetical protein
VLGRVDVFGGGGREEADDDGGGGGGEERGRGLGPGKHRETIESKCASSGAVAAEGEDTLFLIVREVGLGPPLMKDGNSDVGSKAGSPKNVGSHSETYSMHV